MKLGKCILLLTFLLSLIITSMILSSACNDDDDDNDNDNDSSIDDDNDTSDDDDDNDSDDDDNDTNDDDNDTDDDDNDTDDDDNDTDDDDNDTALTNYALEFDGTDDLVNVYDSTSLDIIAPFTIEAWIKIYNNEAKYSGILLKFDYISASNFRGWGLELKYGKLRFWVGDNNQNPVNQMVISPDDLYLDQWIHVAGTYDGSEMKMWIDGEMVGSLVTDIEVPATNINLNIGHERGVYSFNGVLDELRISTTVRYNSTFFPLEAFDVDEYTAALWHLDEGAGTVCSDTSANSNDGAIDGATWIEH